jgi:hypothetical protein
MKIVAALFDAQHIIQNKHAERFGSTVGYVFYYIGLGKIRDDVIHSSRGLIGLSQLFTN